MVRLSVDEEPESELASKSGTLGTVGAAVSIVTVSDGEATEMLPTASVALVVSTWLPAPKVGVSVQLPEPSAVVVPTTVVPSYNVTVALASAVPDSTGAVLEVMLSVLDDPLSDDAARSGADGIAGATVSIEMVDDDDAVLPATSVATALRVNVPSASAEAGVKVHAPEPLATTVESNAAPREMAMDAPGSAVPEMVGVPVASALPVDGARIATVTAVSTVIDRAPDKTEVTAVAVAVAVMLCTPGVSAVATVTDHTPLALAEAVPMSVAPSYRLTTANTGAVPVNVGVVTLVMLSMLEEPESEAVARSGVVGAAVTIGAAMFRLTPVDVVLFPAASVAKAVRMREPAARFDAGVNVHTPEALAVTVPSVVAPSFTTTVALASAVPEMIGAKFVVEEPSRGDTMATAGPAVSTVTTRAGDAAETLPALSVEVVVKECDPEPSAVVVKVQLPLALAVALPIWVAPS